MHRRTFQSLQPSPVSVQRGRNRAERQRNKFVPELSSLQETVTPVTETQKRLRIQMKMMDADRKPSPFWSGWILLALVSKEFLKSIVYSACLSGGCVQAWMAGCEQKELQIELGILNAIKTAGSLDWSGLWVYFCETAGCAAAHSVTNHHWMWLALKKKKTSTTKKYTNTMENHGATVDARNEINFSILHWLWIKIEKTQSSGFFPSYRALH